MFERSALKAAIIDELVKYDRENLFAVKKATVFQLAEDLKVSESSVSKILRHLKYGGIAAKSAGGSWHLA